MLGKIQENFFVDIGGQGQLTNSKNVIVTLKYNRNFSQTLDRYGYTSKTLTKKQYIFTYMLIRILLMQKKTGKKISYTASKIESALYHSLHIHNIFVSTSLCDNTLAIYSKIMRLLNKTKGNCSVQYFYFIFAFLLFK